MTDYVITRQEIYFAGVFFDPLTYLPTLYWKSRMSVKNRDWLEEADKQYEQKMPDTEI